MSEVTTSGRRLSRAQVRTEKALAKVNYKYTANNTNSSSNLLDTMAFTIRFILSRSPPSSISHQSLSSCNSHAPGFLLFFNFGLLFEFLVIVDFEATL